MKGKPTIYDVAKQAGVSIATVSRVLNSPQRVNESTRKKVLTSIAELRFIPKAEARTRGDFRRIGVLTPFFTHPSFVERMRGIANELVNTESELIVYAVESIAQLRGYLDMLPVSHRIDGLIMVAMPVDDGAARRLKDNHLETVLIEYHHALFSSIEIDDIEGGRCAAKYLLNKGYRRLAFVGEAGEPPYSLHASDLRLEGFRRMLDEAGIPLPAEYVGLNPFSVDNVVRQVEKYFELRTPPEAIFASSDMQAIGILKAARKLGLKVPGDLGVLGFDNIELADYLELSTIDQSLDESGRTAVELLLGHLRDSGRAVRNIILQLKIVERSSA